MIFYFGFMHSLLLAYSPNLCACYNKNNYIHFIYAILLSVSIIKYAHALMQIHRIMSLLSPLAIRHAEFTTSQAIYISF